MHAQGYTQAQKRPKENPSLNLRLMPGSNTACNNQKQKQKHRTENPGKEGRIRFPQLLHYRMQMSSFQQQQSQESYKERMIHMKGKNKPLEIVPEKEQTADLLDKDFHTTVLKMFIELEEDIEKVEKTM